MKISSLQDLRAFAKQFVEDNPRGAVVALSGELGAGKTTFVRAVIEEIAAKENRPAPRVASPSFVLHQSYSQFSRPVDHFDLYRLEGVTREGLLETGYFEAWERAKQKNGFLFVEWPEKMRDPKELKCDRHLSLSLSTAGASSSERFLTWLS